MISTVPIGPLAVPTAPLVFAVAAWLGLAVGRRSGRGAGIDPEPLLLRMLLLGLVAARLAFVWEWRTAYLGAPWSVLDLRDGGWEPVAGLAAALLYGLSRVTREAALRKPVVRATLATLAVWGAGQLALLAWPGEAPQPMPTLTLSSLDGQPLPLARFAGKPTVLNLWATWCPPCRREMPLLQQAQAAHPEIDFVFINQGESAAAVQRYLQAERLPLRNVALDAAQTTGAAFDLQGLPTTLFFDAQGRRVSTRTGALSEATLAQALQRLQSPASSDPPHPATP